MSYRQIGILRGGLFLLLLSGGSLVLLLFCSGLSRSGGLLSLGLLCRGRSLFLRGLGLTSELGVVRLSLLKLGLELAGVCKITSVCKITRVQPPNRHTLRVGKADRERLRGGGGLRVIGSDLPDPATIGSDVGLQLHLGGDLGGGSERVKGTTITNTD